MSVSKCICTKAHKVSCMFRCCRGKNIVTGLVDKLSSPVNLGKFVVLSINLGKCIVLSIALGTSHLVFPSSHIALFFKNSFCTPSIHDKRNQST